MPELSVVGCSSVFAGAWGAQAQEGRRAGDGLHGANQTNKTGSNTNLMFTLFGSGKHLVGVNKGLKYFFNHPEMSVSPLANVAFRTAAWEATDGSRWALRSHYGHAKRDRCTGIRCISTVKCNLRCFCIYLYVQIQRIRCKIYINIYPVQLAFISFSLKASEYIESKKKYSTLWGNPSWHHEENKVCSEPFTTTCHHPVWMSPFIRGYLLSLRLFFIYFLFLMKINKSIYEDIK